MTLRVLVSRTDRIGDVVLTLPVCGLLKARLGAHVTFLVRPYARDVAAACPAVDEVIEWDAALGRAEGVRRIAATRADVVLHERPDAAVAWAAWRAGVPVRVGTSRRAFHWLLCNRREPLARRASPLHEAQLNVALARSLLGDDATRLAADALAPFGAIRPRAPLPDALRPFVGGRRFTLVVHPRSGGSAAEWPLAHWSALVRALPRDRFRVLVTGSAAEGAALAPWLREQPGHVHDVTGRTDVASLIALLAAADGVVAASTGPLHLAAAAGARTLGLFSPRRPIHPGRWAPIGARAEVLVADLAPERIASAAAVGDVATIPVEAVVRRVERWAAERESGG